MKRILVLLMCFNIVLAPTYVFATTNLGGWSIGGLVADGASSIVNGTKNVVINGANVVKTSTAKITPTVGAVSKVLARGAAGYALSVAVEQLLGSVDWVLDPANNQIIYKTSSTDPQAPSNQFYYIIPYNGYNTQKFTTADQACRYAFSTGLGDVVKASYPYYSHASNRYCYLTQTEGINGSFVFSDVAQVANPKYDIEQDKEKKLSLDTVAAQVISNAESETDEQKKSGAQSATTAAAQDMLANDAATQSDVETQLNTNAKTQTSEQATGNTKTNEANPQVTDISLSFPAFCGWAPVVCEAAQVAISFPQTVTNWWTTATAAISASWTSFKEWLDWTKNDDSLPDSEQNSVTELPTPELQENAISWGASCPADVQIPISLYGQSSTLTFSWSPWCQLLSIIKPAIIASAYIGAAFIVLGLRT